MSISSRFPKDPRFFRLPNQIFTMIKIDKTGGPVNPNAPLTVPKERDPKLVAFKVPLNFNKIQIRNYLEEIYKVEIEKVHTLIYLGTQQHTQHTRIQTNTNAQTKTQATPQHMTQG